MHFQIYRNPSTQYKRKLFLNYQIGKEKKTIKQLWAVYKKKSFHVPVVIYIYIKTNSFSISILLFRS